MSYNQNYFDYTKEKYMWKEIKYSKKQIDKAGQTIIKEGISEEERKQCLEIIDNWRAVHAFPMNTFAINLKKKIGGRMGPIVVQRLKRLDTIVEKLARFPDMQLSRMQDLGGCRVILPKIEDVYAMRDKIVKSSIRHKLHNEKDYIKSPNPHTGYRGIHLIYKYKSDRNTKYNGLFIEIQLRTKLQHMWATAVETVGMFTQNGLKFNQGEKEWLQFFQLVSCVFAVEEEKDKLTDLIDVVQHMAVIKELLALVNKFDIFNKLYAFAAATIVINQSNKPKNKFDKEGYYLLELDLDSRDLKLTYYPKGEKSANRAIEKYMEIETNKDTKTNAVLVSAKSITALKKAYPNYFADIKDFTDKLLKFVKEQNDKCGEILKSAENSFVESIMPVIAK